ncbi:MAG: hypothetical protein U1F68_10290 [Gammaproteobacteria bacterium]
MAAPEIQPVPEPAQPVVAEARQEEVVQRNGEEAPQALVDIVNQEPRERVETTAQAEDQVVEEAKQLEEKAREETRATSTTQLEAKPSLEEEQTQRLAVPVQSREVRPPSETRPQQGLRQGAPPARPGSARPEAARGRPATVPARPKPDAGKAKPAEAQRPKPELVKVVKKRPEDAAEAKSRKQREEAEGARINKRDWSSLTEDSERTYRRAKRGGKLKVVEPLAPNMGSLNRPHRSSIKSCCPRRSRSPNWRKKCRSKARR